MVNGREGCPAEAELIDEALGKLPAARAQAVRAHLRQCAVCCRQHGEWRELVALPKDSEVLWSSSTAPPERESRFVEDAGAASPSVPRLSRNRRLQLYVHAAHKLLQQHPLPWHGVAVAAVLFLCLAGLQQTGRQPRVSELPSATMLQDAGTRQVQVVPASAKVKGSAWVNPGHDEVLLLMDGLARQDDTDYQVWSEGSGQPAQLGLLQWSGRTAMLHYKGERIEQANRLSVSVEPKGGSVRPTGPELAWAVWGP